MTPARLPAATSNSSNSATSRPGNHAHRRGQAAPTSRTPATCRPSNTSSGFAENGHRFQDLEGRTKAPTTPPAPTAGPSRRTVASRPSTPRLLADSKASRQPRLRWLLPQRHHDAGRVGTLPPGLLQIGPASLYVRRCHRLRPSPPWKSPSKEPLYALGSRLECVHPRNSGRRRIERLENVARRSRRKMSPRQRTGLGGTAGGKGGAFIGAVCLGRLTARRSDARDVL